MREFRIFYCWQSDIRPAAVNRSLIEDALGLAVRDLQKDAPPDVKILIDKDTLDVAGSPEIARTIFGKIRQAQVFVCDVSIINKDVVWKAGIEPVDGSPPRPTPNPNVLIELGYALGVLDDTRVLLVFNDAFGTLDQLPFDLRTRRVVPYKMSVDNTDRSTGRQALAKKLLSHIRINFQTFTQEPPIAESTLPSITDQLIATIENTQPARIRLVRQFMTWILSEVANYAGIFVEAGEPDELLLLALDKTPHLVVAMSRVAETIAAYNDEASARELYKHFRYLLEHYRSPRNMSQQALPEFDLYRFIGHELFTTFFSFLIRDERWILVRDLLNTKIYVDNANGGQPTSVDLAYVSEPVRLLIQRKKRLKSNRISLHSDLLKERHEASPLAEIIAFSQFMDADYFLFLRSILKPEEVRSHHRWYPWSVLYINWQTPSYLYQAYDLKYALQLFDALGLPNLATFQARLQERAQKELENIFGWDPFPELNPLGHLEIEKIGTRA